MEDAIVDPPPPADPPVVEPQQPPTQNMDVVFTGMLFNIFILGSGNASDHRKVGLF